jgi:hypothetical protein
MGRGVKTVTLEDRIFSKSIYIERNTTKPMSLYVIVTLYPCGSLPAPLPIADKAIERAIRAGSVERKGYTATQKGIERWHAPCSP